VPIFLLQMALPPASLLVKNTVQSGARTGSISLFIGLEWRSDTDS